MLASARVAAPRPFAPRRASRIAPLAARAGSDRPARSVEADDEASSSLGALLSGRDLSDAVGALDARRIERVVASLERDRPGPAAPLASPLLDREWVLRYTSSPGTVGAIGAWRAVAGAVADVRQTVRRRDDDAASTSSRLRVVNVVTIAVRGGAGVRITQTFDADVESKRRCRTQLLTSDVELVRGGDGLGGRDGEGSDGLFAAPIRLVADALFPGAAPGATLATLAQPFARDQPSKTQLTTHLSERWRITRDAGGRGEVNVYERARG
jgi:hypothetical protein